MSSASSYREPSSIETLVTYVVLRVWYYIVYYTTYVAASVLLPIKCIGIVTDEDTDLHTKLNQLAVFFIALLIIPSWWRSYAREFAWEKTKRFFYIIAG